ncbi:unnamed protein product [Symbiodinium sp. CCMP2592]|nr:unnamed protein product [Symbiodinium sp. CCMP2592]
MAASSSVDGPCGTGEALTIALIEEVSANLELQTRLARLQKTGGEGNNAEKRRLDVESLSSEDEVPVSTLEETKADVIAEVSHFTKYISSGLGSDLSGLPVRFLPPGNVSELYVDFCSSFTDQARVPSFACFGKAFTDISHILKFRPKGEFTECDVCEALKAKIKDAQQRDMASLVSATHELRLHYHNVGVSRDLEEALRLLPPDGPKAMLVMMTDGMDQAHWSVPRLPGWKAGKQFSTLHRPRCIVQGCWVFHYGLHFIVADKTQPHDSNFVVETVARALEHVHRTAVRLGRPLPREFVLWTDNTTRENKNNTLLAFMSLLIHRGVFSLSCVSCHIEGHTHNILDQLFGIIARSFQYVDKLEDIWAVIDELRRILKKPSLRQFLGGAEVDVTVECMEGCRHWAKYLEELQVRLDGGLLSVGETPSNHMFLWMHRKDLPAPVARRVLPLARARRNQPDPFVAHPLDVVLLQKQYVWETDLKCDPQVVLPHVLGLRFHTAQGYVPRLLRPPNRPDAEGWLLCAKALLQMYPSGNMVRTVKYLQELAAGQRGQSTDFPDLPWFESCRGRTDVEAALACQPEHLNSLVPSLATRAVYRGP